MWHYFISKISSTVCVCVGEQLAAGFKSKTDSWKNHEWLSVLIFERPTQHPHLELFSEGEGFLPWIMDARSESNWNPELPLPETSTKILEKTTTLMSGLLFCIVLCYIELVKQQVVNKNTVLTCISCAFEKTSSPTIEKKWSSPEDLAGKWRIN